MKRKLFVVLFTGFLALTGCNGNKKTDKETFIQDVAEALLKPRPIIEKEKYSGWIKIDGREYFSFTVKTLPTNTGEKSGFHADMYRYAYEYKMKLNPLELAAAKDAKFYVGNGYRIVDGKSSYSWDEHLNLVKVKIPNECNFTIKPTYRS